MCQPRVARKTPQLPSQKNFKAESIVEDPHCEGARQNTNVKVNDFTSWETTLKCQPRVTDLTNILGQLELKFQKTSSSLRITR